MPTHDKYYGFIVVDLEIRKSRKELQSRSPLKGEASHL